ncbi:MAG TPA: hypothetical protein DEQ32_13505 [Gammaproteobacteria bacterium]|nr:hypothetical protein [Gammaproteobacteria bacterium]
MAIDMSKMRARKQALENRGNGGGSKFWRPQDGEQTIRIVPTADGDPFKDFWFHYNVGDNPGFLSPKKNFGEDDPLDAFVRKLFNEGTEDSVRMAKNLMARQRFFAPVIVRGEEAKGVRIWGFGKTVYEQLINLVLNPEYGDITDPETGTDLVLHYGKPAGASFPQTKLTPRRRHSPLCDETNGGDEYCAELMENIPDFNTLFERKTPQEVGDMLDAFLLGDEGAEATSSETEKYNSTTVPPGSTATTNSVDRAFDELMNA